MLYYQSSLDISWEDIPYIAYYDPPNGKLKYAYAVSSGGNCRVSNDWQCDNITSIGTNLSQLGISLAVDTDYHPIIAYMDASEELGAPSLKIAYPRFHGNCGPATPLYSWQCSAVDGGGAYQDEAAFVSLAVSSSNLVTIAYSELDSYTYPNISHLKIAYQRNLLFMPVINK